MHFNRSKLIYCCLKQRFLFRVCWTCNLSTLSTANEISMTTEQGRNERGKGGAIPGRWITAVGAEWQRGAEMSHQCRKYFLQHSIFASEEPQVRTRGRGQTRFLPRAPFNLLTPLRLTIFCWLLRTMRAQL